MTPEPFFSVPPRQTCRRTAAQREMPSDGGGLPYERLDQQAQAQPNRLRGAQCFVSNATGTKMKTERGRDYPWSHLLPSSDTAAHIHELLRSHGPPPELLPFTISAFSDELAGLDQQISQLQDSTHLGGMESDRRILYSHYTACLSVLAPIRRVPSEILVEIFQICLDSFLSRQNTTMLQPRAFEMARLAHSPLFTVSQVCARWHGIVMGNPSLWSTIELDSLVWAEEGRIDIVMALIESILERGDTSPLNLSICGETHPPALQLLAAHSERWKTVEIMCSMRNFQHLAGVKGKIPQLETLMLDIWGVKEELAPMDFFAIAPRLKSCSASGELVAATVTLPPHRMHTLGCIDLVFATEILAAVALMSCPTPPTKFQLQFNPPKWAYAVEPSDPNIPPVISTVGALSMDTRNGFSREDCLGAFGAILPILTLPSLHEFSFNSVQYPAFPIYWPHTEFLAISARSSFDSHLHTLRLAHVVITEAELLESLSALPLLQWLEIGEHQLVGGDLGAEPHLITNNLFSTLTRTSGSPSFIPHLRHLSCWSLLQFDDTKYLDCLLSRLQEVPFEAELRSLPGRHRALDPNVFQRLWELRVQKKLKFSFYDSFKSCTCD
ncbi:hypothetical protein B0H11DRAFT_2191192 [Mycena galericulata]|nr:hypothetical protein B0H11DRAFT_2191192 [Mycena galericulata]